MALIHREVSGRHKELQVHVPVLRICGRPFQHLALHRQLHQLSSGGARAQTRGDVQTRRARGADGAPRWRWSGAAAVREQRRRHAARNQHLNASADSEHTAKAVEALLDRAQQNSGDQRRGWEDMQTSLRIDSDSVSSTK